MYKRILIIASLPFMIFAAQWQSLNAPPAGRADDMSIGKYGLQYHIYWNAPYLTWGKWGRCMTL